MEQHEEQVVATDVAGETNEGSTMLERLRARRVAIAKPRHADLDIPGYNGLLVLRVRPVAWKWLRDRTEAAQRDRSGWRELNAHCDVIIQATDEILVRENDELQPINPDGEPTRWDDRLVALLQLGDNVKRARDVVRATFNNDVAVSVFYAELMEWLQESNAEADEEFQGESEGTQR